MIARIALSLATVVALVASGPGCGGDKKPAPKKPIVKKDDDKKPTGNVAETEEDREKKRRSLATAIVPDGAKCFPQSLKEAGAPRLELAAIGSEAVICANDIDPGRLLGPVACWKVDLAESGLVYQPPNPLPQRSLSVKLDDRCARGFCLPKDAKLPGDNVVHMAWNDDGSKAIVVAGDELHIFDGTAHARESGFSIRGDKGVTGEPTAVTWVGDAIFIQGAGAGSAAHVYGFKLDGTPLGALTALGGKDAMLSTHLGSFVILDKNRVGVAEHGFTTITTFEIDSGKRAKIVRNVNNGPCKKPEVEAFWNQSGDVGAKCKDHMTKTYGHLIGADAVAGKTNLLVLLRGSRLGELAVLDAKNLTEKKSIMLPWCTGSNGADASDAKDDKKDKEAPAKTRAPTKKKPAKEDPDQGGQ